MRSLTIHGLDDVLDRKLKVRSRRSGLSLNKTIKALLGESLGAVARPRPDHAGDFAGFLGKWSKADAARQKQALAFSRQVNPDDWK